MANPIFTQQKYLISVDKKDGSRVFLRSGTNDAKRTVATTADPAMAELFDLDVEKEIVLEMIDRARAAVILAKQLNLSSFRIMIYETSLTEVSADDYEWKLELQRNGVAKLTRLEIEALGLQKFEIERKMAKS